MSLLTFNTWKPRVGDRQSIEQMIRRRAAGHRENGDKAVALHFDALAEDIKAGIDR